MGYVPQIGLPQDKPNRPAGKAFGRAQQAGLQTYLATILVEFYKPHMDDLTALAALSALAHPDRLRAFRLMVVAGSDGIASGQIAARLDIAPTRMSFHLAVLDRAGLACTRRAGRQMIYALRPEAMRALIHYLAKDCCDGRPEFCDLKGLI